MRRSRNKGRVIPKSSIVLGLLMLVTLFAGRISVYWQGVAFEESMLVPFIVVPLALALAICFVITGVRTFIRVLKREVHVSWLGGFGCVLLLTYMSFEIPLPTFVDGLAKTVEEHVGEPLLLGFAADVRETNRVNVGDVPDKYSPVLSLSDINAAIRITDDAVYVSWGGEPRGTWGVAIAAQDGFAIPADHVPPRHTRKVYDRVWVFKTR